MAQCEIGGPDTVDLGALGDFAALPEAQGRGIGTGLPAPASSS